MKMALKDQPDTPFRVPPGIKLISVDAHSGTRSSGPGSILEAFKPGTAPPDSYTNSDSPHVLPVPSDLERQMGGGGTGGLY